jgi:hypothetical protein
MNIRKGLLPCIVLCVGGLVISFGAVAGKKTDTGASSGTMASGLTAAGQSVNPDSSAAHITSTGNAVAVDPVFEFEPVLEGETVTHEFTIKNTGLDELKILKVRTG